MPIPKHVLRASVALFLLQVVVIGGWMQLQLSRIGIAPSDHPRNSYDGRSNSRAQGVSTTAPMHTTRSATGQVHESNPDRTPRRTAPDAGTFRRAGSAKPYTLSIVVACKDRAQLLQQALASWLELPEIAEIIVVDWSSEEPLQDVLSTQLDDAKQAGTLKIITVSGERHWVLSRAYNLGAQFTTGDVVIKCDSESLLKRTFVQAHSLARLPLGHFYRGYGSNASDANEEHLNGLAAFHRTDFFALRVTIHIWVVPTYSAAPAHAI
eukprot:scaffold603_cov404-Prasinococcus_capsulatus_cf.AAC.63